MSGFDLDELTRAIEAGTGSEPGSMTEKLARVGELALDELLRRLGNPETSGELASTGLLNLANAYLKLREKQVEAEAGKRGGEEQDEIDVVVGSNLPAARKVALLKDALRRHEEQQSLIREAITSLEGKR